MTPFPLNIGMKNVPSVRISNGWQTPLWDANELVVPPGAKKNCFTIIGFDNVDCNAKAALSKAASTIHGTIICVHQFLANDNDGTNQDVEILCPEVSGMKSIKMLPAYYNTISDDYIVTNDDKLFIPTINIPIAPHDIPARDLLQEEFSWLKDASTLVRKDHLEKYDWVSFSA